MLPPRTRPDGPQPGVSSAPPVAAAAACQPVTVTTPAPNRAVIAVTAHDTAATASPQADPVGSGNTGSTATATTRAVKNDRTTSSRPPSRRSQPRTVSEARPKSFAICR